MGRKKKEIQPEGQLSLITELQPKQDLTTEQAEFIDYEGLLSILLIATAGSGKTFSCVQRLKKLLERGVDPSRIIFFSFTKAAADELISRIQRDDIEIKTIHAFCQKLLAAMGKFKPVVTFYEFIPWLKKKYAPSKGAPEDERLSFEDFITSLYNDAETISAQISAFKLQTADGIKVKVPPLFTEYTEFVRETRSRDFSDMLIEVRNLLREDKWLRMFKNKYDHIFIDEYQDTSSIQMGILLSLNAKHYYLIGDRNQSIYGYSGANCEKIEDMLKERRNVKELTLSTNFRSDINIVENSNLYSSLKAVASSKAKGLVFKRIILKIDDLVTLINKKREIVILVRTNAVIKRLEYELMKRLVPMRYFNYITQTELKDIKKGESKPITNAKLDSVAREAKISRAQLLAFIEENSESKRFITSIHKSKGREFEVCVVVNSISRDILEENELLEKMNEKQLERLSFTDDPKDYEAKNIHYVAVTRSKHELYYMIYDV